MVSHMQLMSTRDQAFRESFPPHDAQRAVCNAAPLAALDDAARGGRGQGRGGRGGRGAGGYVSGQNRQKRREDGYDRLNDAEPISLKICRVHLKDTRPVTRLITGQHRVAGLPCVLRCMLYTCTNILAVHTQPECTRIQAMYTHCVQEDCSLEIYTACYTISNIYIEQKHRVFIIKEAYFLHQVSVNTRYNVLENIEHASNVLSKNVENAGIFFHKSQNRLNVLY
eukprot:6184570-Pleurochrysis_carterae.AAC.2